MAVSAGRRPATVVARSFLALSMLFVTFLLAVVGATYWGTNNVAAAQRKMLAQWLPLERAASDLERRLLSARIHFVYHVTLGTPGQLELGRADLRECRRSAEAVVRLARDVDASEALEPKVDELMRRLARYQKVLDLLLARVTPEYPRDLPEIDLWRQVGNEAITAAADLSRLTMDRTQEAAHTATSQLQIAGERAVRVGVTCLVLGAFAAALLLATQLRQAREFEARNRLVALGAKVGAVLTEASDLRAGLQQCAEILTEQRGVCFVRVWTLNSRQDIFELEASAGLYTNLDGPHSRIPNGSSRIAKIAQQRTPYFSDSVAQDTWFEDPEWARREQIGAFVGYPLVIGDRVLGVVAAFSREKLDAAVLEAMESASKSIAQFVERARTHEELRRSESRFRRLVESNMFGVSVADQNGMIVDANDAYLRMVGFTRRELDDGLIRWDALMPPEYAVNFHAADVQSQADGVCAPRDIEHLRKDGTRFPALVGSAQLDERGVRALMFVLDLTQLKLLESQLVQSHKLELVGQLAAGIAHEINTPIQYVGDNIRFLQWSFSSIAEVIKQAERSFEEVKGITALAACLEDWRAATKQADTDYLMDEVPRAIEQSVEGIQRVADIVKAMKEFSHPGGVEMEFVDINHAIASTATVCRNEWKYAAEVSLDLDQQMPYVRCLLAEINQVVLNLIVNAAHAIADTPEGKLGRGAIAISTRKDGDWAEIQIRDNGPGIPKEIEDRIFTPFFTTKGVGKGTGQGLYMARTAIVKKHGGEIRFENNAPDPGVTFTIRIPIAGIAVEGAASEPSAFPFEVNV